jgi:predicted nicotinamide N-methyase
MKFRLQSVSIAGRQIEFELPADPEEMLQAALEGESTGRAGSDPYWGLLWAAAPVTAELILRHAWSRSLTALELGCGVGLTGIAALCAGHRVTFSDHSPAAVQTALANARRNGFADAAGLTFGWHEPPQRQYEFIFASDVLYDSAGHGPLLHALHQLLAPGGCVWIGDAGRAKAPQFAERALVDGWQLQLFDHRGVAISAPDHLQFRLLRLSRRAIPVGLRP